MAWKGDMTNMVGAIFVWEQLITAVARANSYTKNQDK